MSTLRFSGYASLTGIGYEVRDFEETIPAVPSPRRWHARTSTSSSISITDRAAPVCPSPAPLRATFVSPRIRTD